MGRRRSKKQNNWRDTRSISNRQVARTKFDPTSYTFRDTATAHSYDPSYDYDENRNENRRKKNRHLRLIEDRRQHHPSYEDRPARSFNQANHRLIAIGLGASVPVAIGFNRPNKVLTCVRRKIRREVMFALNKTGRRGQRRPKFNWRSFIKCGG